MLADRTSDGEKHENSKHEAESLSNSKKIIPAGAVPTAITGQQIPQRIIFSDRNGRMRRWDDYSEYEPYAKRVNRVANPITDHGVLRHTPTEPPWANTEFSSFKNFLLKILVMRANFGDFGDFGLYGLQNFGKTVVTVVRPYSDQFWKILTFEFW